MIVLLVLLVVNLLAWIGMVIVMTHHIRLERQQWSVMMDQVVRIKRLEERVTLLQCLPRGETRPPSQAMID